MPPKRKGRSTNRGGGPATPTRKDSPARSPNKRFSHQTQKSAMDVDESGLDVTDAPPELQNPANLRVGAGGLYWLTFMNGSKMSEVEIRDMFTPSGEVAELDGAVDGPAGGNRAGGSATAQV